LTKIRENILFIIIPSLLFSVLIVGNINFDRNIYVKFMESELPFTIGTGSLITEETKRVNSIEEIKEIGNTFTIEIDKKDLKPTEVYKRLNVLENNYLTSSTSVWFNRLRGKSYARFYIAALPSDEKVVLLLDEKTISYNDGLLNLPIGQVEKKVPADLMKQWNTEYNLSEDSWYINMVNSYWRASDMAKSIDSTRIITSIVVFTVLYIIFTVIFRKLRLSDD